MLAQSNALSLRFTGSRRHQRIFSNNERVDRWDHDSELRRKLDEAERKSEEEALAKKAAEQAAADKANEAAPAAPPKSTPKKK